MRRSREQVCNEHIKLNTENNLYVACKHVAESIHYRKDPKN